MFPMLVWEATPITRPITPAAPKIGARLIFISAIMTKNRIINPVYWIILLIIILRCLDHFTGNNFLTRKAVRYIIVMPITNMSSTLNKFSNVSAFRYFDQSKFIIRVYKCS